MTMRWYTWLAAIIVIPAVLMSAPKSLFGAVKGNGDSGLYHLSGCPSYTVTKIGNHHRDQYFWSEEAARNAGFRKASNCY